ncbi:SDR family NAD(P)-dependent oxidoreductase [Aspergillus affinis]|uniref:SDR family NAD(P)-dependent oxidoreductase n=1 Tax=Aspergillus affinis TaxID=1070780 RepID=UPI0022FE4AE5|nr:uncharacterized protein KD926_004362 [Aspergillus affinis]KAI9043179.1 hypothetical protein KD926_004362 [Aspergillus affinis]
MDVPGFAVITGAASGLGKACAIAFAREGAAGVALLDVNNDGLLDTKAEIELAQDSWNRSRHCQLEAFTVNVTDEDQVNQAMQTIASKFGRLDYVVNAAGITIRHEQGAAYASAADWQRVIDTNLTGTFLVFRASAQIMLKQEPLRSSLDGRELQRGSFVSFGSILSLVGKPMSTGYIAAKHGVLGLTRTASEDYADKGLRINTICPGYIDTPMAASDELIQRTSQEALAHKVPMKRFGTPQEVADGVLFLSGGRSSFITGFALCVDGGYTQR